MKEERFIITIGRQTGSGGREIGERLAAALGVAFYDKQLIGMAAEKSGMDARLLEQHDERTVNRFLYSIPEEPNRVTGYGLPIVDTLYIVQSQIIRELAQKESCVIIGRCADYVLQGTAGVRSVFIGAPLEERIRRIRSRRELDEAGARDYIKTSDKHRRSYYNFFTDKKWGQREGYQLCIDSSMLGIDGTVQLLRQLAPS